LLNFIDFNTLVSTSLVLKSWRNNVEDTDRQLDHRTDAAQGRQGETNFMEEMGARP
jgi:hypothetical protein